MTKQPWLIGFTLLIVASSPSYSLSCYGLRDHFFVQCTQGICKKAFRVREVTTNGSCGHRIIVEDVPDLIIQYISHEIINGKASNNRPLIFHLIFLNRFYDKPPKTTEEWVRNVRRKNPAYTHQINNTEILPQGTDFEQLKKEWLKQANRELLQTRLYYFFDVSGLFCGFILLLYTLGKYKNLTKWRFYQENYKNKILKPLSIQVGLLCFGLIPWLFYYNEAVYILFLAPLIIIVWMYEIIYYMKPQKPIAVG